MKYFLFLVMLFWSFLSQAATTVRFDPKVISLGESTQLIIESDRPFTTEPDFSALTGKFAVAGQQQGVKSVSVNGRRTTHYQMSLNVFPRKAGTLSTGDLTINGKQIQGATLTVEEASGNTRLPVTFTATVSKNKVYLDETFLYQIKLVYAVALMDAKIMPPAVQGARITQLDSDKSYQAYIDEKPMHVFERTFAVTPEKKGNLEIPPVEVYGLVHDTRNDPGDLFAQGMLFNGLLGGQKEVRLETNPIQLSVEDKPKNWTGWWLPATDVKISTKDSFPDKIAVGDSLTRVIELTAIGVSGEQLPVISQPAGKSFKVYPSPEKRETVQTENGDIQGISQTSIMLVPSKPGTIIIPEIRVKWFNTNTQNTEEAVLEEKTITVEGTEETVTEEEETDIKQPPESKIKKNRTPNKPKVTQAATDDTSKIGIYWAIAGAILTLCLGIGLGFILFRRHKNHSYLIVDKTEQQKKKKKKPLPDLYPF